MSEGIHAGLEVRARGHKQWTAVVPSVDVDEVANRTIFTLLAGKSSTLGVQPVVPIRGLPSDLSATIRTLHNQWGGTTSQANWVTPGEVNETIRLITAMTPTQDGGLDQANVRICGQMSSN